MATYIEMCNELNLNEDEVIKLIKTITNEEHYIIPLDYLEPIVKKCAKMIIVDIYETADHENWNLDDLKLSFGRVLAQKLHIDID